MKGVYQPALRNVLSLVADINDDWVDCRFCTLWQAIVNHNGSADSVGEWFVEGSFDRDDLDEPHRFSNVDIEWWRTAAGLLVFGGSPVFAAGEDATLFVNVLSPMPYMRLAWVGSGTGVPQAETFQSGRSPR